MNVVSTESKHGALAVTVFVAVFILLHGLILAARGTSIERFWLFEMTALPAALLLNAADASDPPQAHGNRLQGRTKSLTIRSGCDGTETLPLLLAAIVALRLPWRRTVVVAAAGTLLVLAVNQARIAALWFALGEPAWFDRVHELLAPAILLAGVALIVLLGSRSRVHYPTTG